ncbi:hypothetical protein SAMN04488057_12145 [Cyclobacterium lianum]|uniref:Uncharacterized protein n=1 Tax=Cyclobacterium lianum TaxID=388280 RepID=A0A1M7QPE8_9BACT|nr:hypothetical protein [Cyclobacterium lianum]SHN33284.1 hypothetical protein SAMN04488057_12145 [Cyclobacterium lianum]
MFQANECNFGDDALLPKGPLLLLNKRRKYINKSQQANLAISLFPPIQGFGSIDSKE